MAQVEIQYVGKKPVKADNVANTGVVWNGPGDVQKVDASVAAQLLAHPDVWAKAEGDATEVPPVKDEGLTITKEDDESAIPPLPFNVDEAGKDQLVEHAMREYGLDLDKRTKLETLRDQVRTAIVNRTKQEG